MREYDESELHPLNEDSADFIVSLCIDLDKTLETLEDGELKNLLEVASSNLMRLTALSMAGYHLYSIHRKTVIDLHEDIKWLAQILGEYQPTIASAIIDKYNERIPELLNFSPERGDGEN